MEAWIGVIGIVVGAAAGALVTLVTTRNRIRFEQEAKFDSELRTLRLPHYQALHHLSVRLPRQFADDDRPTRADLLAIREEFHTWYFGPSAGGMFLTEEARRRYFDLMSKLQTVGDRRDASEEPRSEELEHLLKLANGLRQQLRLDLGTAEAPKVTWKARGETPVAPPRRQGE